MICIRVIRKFLLNNLIFLGLFIFIIRRESIRLEMLLEMQQYFIQVRSFVFGLQLGWVWEVYLFLESLQILKSVVGILYLKWFLKKFFSFRFIVQFSCFNFRWSQDKDLIQVFGEKVLVLVNIVLQRSFRIWIIRFLLFKERQRFFLGSCQYLLK